jgi:uncharacterized protein
MLHHQRLVRAALALALWLALCTARAELPVITLKVGGHALAVEVVSAEPERQRGLMHRRMLPEGHGMLFVFPRADHHGMWMMNTYIPLSVAFLDADGVIINIADMTPHSQDVHAAQRPARYALEANRGWFAKRGIKPGARVEGLDRAPAPR